MLKDIIGIIIAVFSVIGVIVVSFSMGKGFVIAVVPTLIGVIGVVFSSFLVNREEKRRGSKERIDYSAPSSPQWLSHSYSGPLDTTVSGDGTYSGFEETTTLFGQTSHTESNHGSFFNSPEWLVDLDNSDHTVIIDNQSLPYGSLINTKTGREYSLDRLVSDIGRSQSCKIIIPDRTVSKRHALLRAKLNQEGKAVLTIEDLSSSNGTIVNGNRIASSEHVILRDEDIITLGESQLKYKQFPLFQLAIEKMSVS